MPKSELKKSALKKRLADRKYLFSTPKAVPPKAGR